MNRAKWLEESRHRAGIEAAVGCNRRDFLRSALALALSSAGGLAVGGCGGGSLESGPPGPPPLPRAGAFPNPLPNNAKLQSQAQTTVALKAGWNAVGFETLKVTALAGSAQVAGLAWWDGQAYQLRSLAPSAINELDGTRRGFWVFAQADTAFSYEGEDDGRGNFANLLQGWNLVAFPSDSAISGSELKATQNGQSVPLGSVVLAQFLEIQANNSYQQVDVTTGGQLKPGRAYWVFALGAVRLTWGSATPVTPGIGGVTVSGQVNVAELGGSNVTMGSVLHAQAPISATGGFQLSTSPDRPLIVFATDGAKMVRGLAVNIPGRPLQVDAKSTALSLMFMTLGLSSSDPVEAGQRLDAWAARPSFATLVSSLRALLPGAGLAAAVKSPGVQAALASLVQAGVPRTMQAKDQPFTYPEMLAKQPGGLRSIYKSEQPGASITFELQNIGFRFVSVVRQRKTVRGDEVDTLKPDLVGSPFVANTKNTVNGVNSFSLGNLFTSQAFTAGSAQDQVILNDTVLPLDKAIYWFKGLGLLTSTDHVAPPPEVADLLDSSTADFFTVVYYLLMPLLEPFAAVGGAAEDLLVLNFRSPKLLEELANIYAGPAQANTVLTTQAAINTGDIQNISAGLIDAIIALFTPFLIETLGALVAGALGVEVAVATAPISLMVAACLAGMSAANALLAAQYYAGKKIPRVTAVEMPLPLQGFMDSLATPDELTSVLGISSLGTALYSNPAGALVLKEFTKAPEQVATAVRGRITNLDGVVYLRSSDDNPVVLGETTLPQPAGFESWSTFLGVSADSKKIGGLFTGGGSRAYVFDKDTGPNMIPAPIYQDYKLSTVAMGTTELFTVGVRGSGTSGHHARLRFNPGTGSWTEIIKEQTQAVGFGQAGVVEEKYVQANKFDEVLGLRVYWSGDLFDGVRVNFKSFLDTPFGTVPIQEVDADINQAEHGVTGLNDEGDVVGFIKFPNQEMAGGYLWKRGPAGERLNGVLIKTRLPAGAPAGEYLPSAIGGSYVVLAHYASPNTLTSYYVWFMGRTRQDLYPDPA